MSAPFPLSPRGVADSRRLAHSGSQTARTHTDKPSYARGANSLPPPPLPRAALQLPKARGATAPRDHITIHDGSEHRISRWIATTVGAGISASQPVTQHIEQFFWPTPNKHQPIHAFPEPLPPANAHSNRHHTHPPSSHTASGNHLLPLTPRLNVVDDVGIDSSSSAHHALQLAKQTIDSQQSEIAMLKRHSHAQMSLDLTYDDLQNENRNLKQLKFVIQELERKLDDMKEMRAERKKQHQADMDRCAAENAELTEKYESLLASYLTLERAHETRESEYARLETSHGDLKSRFDSTRLKLSEQQDSFSQLHSRHASVANELILTTSQLDSLRTTHAFIKAELEGSRQEIFSLQRVREMQQELINSLQESKADLQRRHDAAESHLGELHDLPLIRAQLVESRKECTALQESLAIIQRQNDTFESLLEESHMRERSMWKSEEDRLAEEIDVDELVKEYRENEQQEEFRRRRKDSVDFQLSNPAMCDGDDWEEYSSEEEITSIVQNDAVATARSLSPQPRSPTLLPLRSASPSPRHKQTSPAPDQGTHSRDDSNSSATNNQTLQTKRTHVRTSSAPHLDVVPPTIVTTKVRVIKRRPKQKPTQDAPPNNSAPKQPSRPSPSSQPPPTSSSSSVRPAPGSSRVVPAAVSGQTSLSKKLEKCLNDTLRDNTRLSGQVYTLQLHCKSLESRVAAHTRDQQATKQAYADLQLDHVKLQKSKKFLEVELSQSDRMIQQLQADLTEEKLVCEKRSMTLRTLHTELEQLRAGFSASEVASKDELTKTSLELLQTKKDLNFETKARSEAEKREEKTRSELNTLLSQHGLAIKAKELLLSNFSKTAAQNSELNVKLQIAEALASKSKSLEDRIVTIERNLSNSESTVKRVTAENTVLQTSLQSLSDAHTEQTGTLQRLVVKSQQYSLDNSKLQTKIANLLVQLNGEEHAGGGGSASSKSPTAADAAKLKSLTTDNERLQDRIATLEKDLSDEKKAHQTRLENYRSARKESQTNKTKLFNLKSIEVKLRTQLEKELVKSKKLEMENLRIRATHTTTTTTTTTSNNNNNIQTTNSTTQSATTTQTQQQQQPLLTPSASATIVGLPSSGSVSSLSGSSTANLHLSASVAELRPLSSSASADDLDVDVISSSRPASPPLSSLDPSLSSCRPDSPIGGLVDFDSLTSPRSADRPTVTPEEAQAQAEERRREEERRMRRRLPKRTQGGGTNEKEEEPAPAAPTPTAPKGFYADLGGSSGGRRSSLSLKKRSPAPLPAPVNAPASLANRMGTPSAAGSSVPLVDVATDPVQFAVPFLEPLQSPRSLQSAIDKLQHQQHAMATLVQLHSNAATTLEARVTQAEQRADKSDRALRDAEERSDRLAERAQAALKAEQEKYDTLFATNIKTEAQLKLLRQQLAALKAKGG